MSSHTDDTPAAGRRTGMIITQPFFCQSSWFMTKAPEPTAGKATQPHYACSPPPKGPPGLTV